MEKDGYDVLDLEAAILSGSLIEVQRDFTTRERKYLIRGSTRFGREIELVVKLGATGKLIVITVYEPRGCSDMRCDNCGSDDARVLRVTRTYGSGSETLLIENVPQVSCSACGQSYMTAETLHAIDSLRSRRQLAESRTVSVVRFDAA